MACESISAKPRLLINTADPLCRNGEGTRQHGKLTAALAPNSQADAIVDDTAFAALLRPDAKAGRRSEIRPEILLRVELGSAAAGRLGGSTGIAR
jgi:hypothetical protein